MSRVFKTAKQIEVEKHILRLVWLLNIKLNQQFDEVQPLIMDSPGYDSFNYSFTLVVKWLKMLQPEKIPSIIEEVEQMKLFIESLQQ